MLLGYKRGYLVHVVLLLGWVTLPVFALRGYPATQPCEHPPLKSTPGCNVSSSIEERLDSLIKSLSEYANVDEQASLLRNVAGGINVLSIAPYQWWNEALHGVAGTGIAAAGSIPSKWESCVPTGGLFSTHKCATSFPAGITTACSFNKTLMHAVGSAIGTEARVFSNKGVTGLTFWSPNINIFRDPRWGRGQETPGEVTSHCLPSSCR